MAVWVAVELPEELVETIMSLIRRGRYPSISMLVEKALEVYLEMGEAIEKYLGRGEPLPEESRARLETGSRGVKEACRPPKRL